MCGGNDNASGVAVMLGSFTAWPPSRARVWAVATGCERPAPWACFAFGGIWDSIREIIINMDNLGIGHVTSSGRACSLPCSPTRTW